MGRTIGEWKRYFSSLNKSELKQIRNALKTLKKFDVIHEEFDDTGLFLLDTLAKIAIEEKEEKEAYDGNR